ncbi:MAG: hypothetical protein ACR2GB_01810 [Nocardioidaceae bacterium]
MSRSAGPPPPCLPDRVLRAVIAPAVCVVAVSLIVTLVVGRWRVDDAGAEPGSAGIEPAVYSPADTASAAQRSSSREASNDRWHRVLTGLDRWRAAAWRSGRVEVLRRVYVPHSTALRRDRQMLQSYLRRELRVAGVYLAFGPIAVREQERRCVSLDVVDQLGAAVAISRDGLEQPLPTDQPSEHRVTLCRHGEGWLISRVRVS